MTKRLLGSMFLFLLVLTPTISRAEVSPSTVDMSAVFASSDGLVASALSQQEMVETEGAWVWVAAGAAATISGNIGYSVYRYQQTTPVNNRTNGGYAGAVAWGTALGTRAAAYGLVSGPVGWGMRVYAAGTNYGLNYIRWK